MDTKNNINKYIIYTCNYEMWCYNNHIPTKKGDENMKISDSALEYYGYKFVNSKIRETEGITFEEYLKRELGD